MTSNGLGDTLFLPKNDRYHRYILISGGWWLSMLYLFKGKNILFINKKYL